jgi:hypothetical protein
MDPFPRTLFTTGYVALLITASAGSEPVLFDSQAFVPARLPADFDAEINAVLLPDDDNDSDFYLYCVADITSAGRIRHNTCLPYAQFDITEFRDAIVKMMRKTRLSPALFDGNAVPTELYYRLHLDFQSEAPRIAVYPNWGDDVDLHGATYEAPQRYETYRFPRDCLFFIGIARTPLDAQGNVTGDPEFQTLYQPDEPTLECIEKIKARLMKGKYIPARHDGKPVAATHVEVWGDPEKYVLNLPEQE